MPPRDRSFVLLLFSCQRSKSGCGGNRTPLAAKDDCSTGSPRTIRVYTPLLCRHRSRTSAYRIDAPSRNRTDVAGLRSRSSPIELQGPCVVPKPWVRIELTQPVYRTGALPLSHQGMVLHLMPRIGIEPMSPTYQAGALPLNYRGLAIVRRTELSRWRTIPPDRGRPCPPFLVSDASNAKRPGPLGSPGLSNQRACSTGLSVLEDGVDPDRFHSPVEGTPTLYRRNRASLRATGRHTRRSHR